MALCDFSFHRPESLVEAHALAQRLGPKAVYLAGGTELIPDFRRGADSAAHLIALDRVPELAGISMDRDRLRIGAMTTVRQVVASPDVRRFLPALGEAAASLGSAQIRSLATIGGNFCRAVPCADMPPPCMVAGAMLHLANANGQRVVSADAFFTGPRTTVLGRGEILVAIVIPAQPVASGVSYQRFALRRGPALAVASVAARVVLDEGVIRAARVALGAVAPVPLVCPRSAAVLEGQRPTDDVFVLAAAEAAAEARPITDLRGTEGFRRQVVEVLARRAFAEATRRARERAA